jgi:hypothetical protein
MVALYKWFISLICRVFGIKTDEWVLSLTVPIVPINYYRWSYGDIRVCDEYMKILTDRWTTEELAEGVNIIEALTYAWDRKPLNERDRNYIQSRIDSLFWDDYKVIRKFLKKYKGGKYDLSV